MSSLTKAEQDAGVAVIRTWPKDEIAFVAKLSPPEKRLIVLTAALLGIRPVDE